YIQLGERLRCNKKILPNNFKHDGGHIHEEGGFIFVMQSAGSCILPYGLIQFHDIRHGNMSQIAQIELIGEDNEPEYAGQNEENSDQGNDRRLVNDKLKPDLFRKKDFISHELFWERTGFKDPYSVQEQKEFIIYEDSSNIKCSK
ncbi:4896_t:CDS:2, partial [Funneliformis geosporum]